jgi:hypothetical protein
MSQRTNDVTCLQYGFLEGEQPWYKTRLTLFAAVELKAAAGRVERTAAYLSLRAGPMMGPREAAVQNRAMLQRAFGKYDGGVGARFDVSGKSAAWRYDRQNDKARAGKRTWAFR